MLIKSLIITSGSGSVGGVTLSHGIGGMYLRAKGVPTNPQTAFQVAVRNAMGILSAAWVDTLTAAQRLTWEVYASNVTLINSQGDPINVTGLNMYIRSNVPRLQVGLPRVDTGPVIFNVGSFTDPSGVLDEPNDEIDVTFDNTDDWANEDDAAAMIYISKPQNQSIQFFKGPYRFAGKIDGDAITAPTSPAAITLPFPVDAGQRIFWQWRVTRADGRLSAIFRLPVDTAA